MGGRGCKVSPWGSGGGTDRRVLSAGLVLVLHTYQCPRSARLSRQLSLGERSHLSWSLGGRMGSKPRHF